MKTDYPELEGKEITYIYEDGSLKHGIVIGASYHVGITIVNKNIKYDFLICLNKKIHNKKIFSKSYKERFYFYIKQIKNGNFKVKDIVNFYEDKCEKDTPMNNDCAFS